MDRSSEPVTLLADAVVQEDSGVLLLQLVDAANGREGWQLPGGALDRGEHPEAAIRRVLKMQVGLEPEYLALAEVESTPGDHWRLIFHYRCDANRPPTIGEGVRAARFFQLEHLPQTAHGDWERDVIYRVVAG